MTPLEYELLIEKMYNWQTKIIKIEGEAEHDNNGEIQNLKLAIMNSIDQLNSGLQASKQWSNQG